MENCAVAHFALLYLPGCFDGLLRSAQLETTLLAMAEPGALFATLDWITASGLLRLYFHFFTSYARTYGSLGAVMVLLTWLYVTGIMLLLGAEVNMVIEVAAVRPSPSREAGDTVAGA
jgi:YihY family inner membrane protein